MKNTENDARSAANRVSAHEARKREIAATYDAQLERIAGERRAADAALQQLTAEAEQAHSTARGTEQTRLEEEFLTRDERQRRLDEINRTLAADLHERRAALDLEHHLRVRKLGAEEERLERERARLLEEADAAADRANEMAAARFADEWYATVGLLLERYLDTPTKTLAEGIGRTVHTFKRRALHELGAPMLEDLVACAICDELLKTYPAAATVFGEDWSRDLPIGRAITAFDRSLEAGVRAISRGLFSLTDELEAEAQRSTNAAPSAYMQGRYAAKRRCVVNFEPRYAFEREQSAAAQRAFNESYVPTPREPSPAPLPWLQRVFGRAAREGDAA